MISECRRSWRVTSEIYQVDMGPRLDKVRNTGWFLRPGAYVLVDGQYGSTGKGLLASFFAAVGSEHITHVTTNAGPNSGHTAYWGDEKIMTQQLPVSSIFLRRYGRTVQTYMNAGAVIDKNLLIDEMNRYDVPEVFVNQQAAVINQNNRLADMAVTNAIAGTGKGVGPALADKVLRNKDAVLGPFPHFELGFNQFWWPTPVADYQWNWNNDVVFVETAQGFSLGIHSRFYPYTTSRECTVMQAIADARIPAQMVRKVVACFRTFPIRVGNTETGYSGNWYPDQSEISWKDIGVEPEITSVTKRVRRVATWSRTQFKEALAANRPDAIFVNFMNYFSNGLEAGVFLDNLRYDYKDTMGYDWELCLLGYGPKTEDIVVR